MDRNEVEGCNTATKENDDIPNESEYVDTRIGSAAAIYGDSRLSSYENDTHTSAVTDSRVDPIDAQMADNIVRENATQSVGTGIGKRMATLYLSRTSTMIHSPSKKDSSVDAANGYAQGETEDGDDYDETDDCVGELPIANHRAPPGVNREFTFTGYDIMADVDPISTPTDKVQIEKEKSADMYEASCRRLGITPTRYITDRLRKPRIIVKSHGLGPTGTRALTTALVGNKKVKTLDLEDNWIGVDGAKCVSEMLTSNSTITELCIAENRIGSEGIRAISEVMVNNMYIKTLDISGNELTDNDAAIVANFLRKNTHLLQLRASHNSFGEEGGVYLGRAIMNNDTVEVLDLSWNHLRGKGAVAIGQSLRKNLGLKRLNLAWNGFATDGCAALGKSLKDNNTLLELDISCNRIDTKGVGPLMFGVQRNEGLQILHLGPNPITPDVCLVVLKALDKSTKTVLETLDLKDIIVDKAFEDLLKDVQEKKAIQVITGTSIRNAEIGQHKDKLIAGMDPVNLLFEYMNREGYRIIELFSTLDKDGSRSLSHQEFRDGLLSVNVPLTQDQLEQLIERLDTDKDGEVDFLELLDGERTYRRKQLMLKLRKEEKTKQKRRERQQLREKEKKINEATAHEPT